VYQESERSIGLDPCEVIANSEAAPAQACDGRCQMQMVVKFGQLPKVKLTMDHRKAVACGNDSMQWVAQRSEELLKPRSIQLV
jgi:hypothetical protein